MRTLLTISYLALLISCKQVPMSIETGPVAIDTLQGMSLFDTPLISPPIDTQKDSIQLANYKKAYATYLEDTTNVNALIWVGRRIAYLGDYQKAIRYYSKGIAIHPQEARFYRHRGHRYITTRQFDKAIADLNRAAQLIDGTEDQIEPDGIPNKLNTPVSSLHTNIYYHLGLAHYLKNELPNAFMAFQKCLEVSNNNDMQVATRHWLYMIHRRLGNIKRATALVGPIHENMKIIENNAYYQLLLFYKNTAIENVLIDTERMGSSEAILYGLANWHHYNGDVAEATKRYQDLVKKGYWASFGYIAAEADLKRLSQF